MTTRPVRPRDAATVMLVRDAPGGVEVYMLRRAPSMPFAPGAYAFPGGRVDERDADRDVRWAGPAPGTWARTLGTDERKARALVCAAVRETFEESGVLLAGPSEDAVVDDTRGEDWEADRAALVDRTLSFAEMLGRRGLVLRTDLLNAWSQWITPAPEPRRFDTRFFAAELPAGQQARDVGGEADRRAWMPPGEAVRLWRRGEIAMLPPTVSTCMDLEAAGSVAAAMAAEREIAPIEPVLEEVGGRTRIVVPEGVVYPRGEVR